MIIFIYNRNTNSSVKIDKEKVENTIIVANRFMPLGNLDVCEIEILNKTDIPNCQGYYTCGSYKVSVSVFNEEHRRNLLGNLVHEWTHMFQDFQGRLPYYTDYNCYYEYWSAPIEVEARKMSELVLLTLEYDNRYETSSNLQIIWR